MESHFVDALIVGGGPAGLSCALTLARGGRSVVLCDDGHPRNAKARVMNNFPGADGVNPAEFLEKIRKDLEFYPQINLIKSTVVDIFQGGDFFESHLFDGKIIHSKKLVLAEGLVDELPDIPGMEEGWGRSVFQCPYCHAYEQSGEGIGILADPDTLFHVTTLLLGLTEDIIVFTNGKKFLNIKDKEILDFRDIKIVEEKVHSLVMDDDRLIGLELEDGIIIERKALFIKPETRVRSDLGVRLGCKKNERGTYDTDELCRSCVRGVFIAGDESSKEHSVLIACASGSKAGLNLNLELLDEEFHKSIRPYLEEMDVTIL